MKKFLMTLVIMSASLSVLLSGCSNAPASNKELEQQIQLLTQQIERLEESINGLESKLETLSATASSDVDANIDQLGEQVNELGKRLDGLNAEVAAIKQQQSSEQVDKKGATGPPSVPEAPPGTIFTFSGQGKSASLPFTIRSSPWKLQWWADVGIGQVPVTFRIGKPGSTTTGSFHSEVIMETGTTLRQTISYIPSGTYYIEVDTHSWVTWTVWIVEL